MERHGIDRIALESGHAPLFDGILDILLARELRELPAAAAMRDALHAHRLLEIHAAGDGIAIVAMHAPSPGVPALGGIRVVDPAVYDGEPEQSMIEEASRFTTLLEQKARPIAQKFGAHLTAGKVVVARGANQQETEERVARVLSRVNERGTMYVGAEDVGMPLESLVALRARGIPVVGMPEEHGGSGTASSGTAYGTLVALEYLMKRTGRREFENATFAVYGLGKVGAIVAQGIVDRQGTLVCTQRNTVAGARFAAELGARYVAPDELYDVDCDVFVPAAKSGTITQDAAARIRAWAVLGPENGQIAGNGTENELAARHITFVPPQHTNIGGLMTVLPDYCALAGQRAPYANARKAIAAEVERNMARHLRPC